MLPPGLALNVFLQAVVPDAASVVDALARGRLRESSMEPVTPLTAVDTVTRTVPLLLFQALWATYNRFLHLILLIGREEF